MTDNIKNALSEEELEKVNGGTVASAHMGETNSQDKSYAYEKHDCAHCRRKTVFRMYSGTRGVCTECNNPLEIV